MFDSQSRFHPMQRHIQQDGAHHAALGYPGGGRMEESLLQVARLEPLAKECPTRIGTQGMKESGVRQIVESPFDIPGYHPFLPTRGPGQKGALADGIVAAAAWPDPIVAALKPRFPKGFESVLDLGLEAAVKNTRNAKGPEAVMGFGNVHPSDWPSTPRLAGGQSVHQVPARLWGLHHQLVDPRRLAASIELRVMFSNC